MSCVCEAARLKRGVCCPRYYVSRIFIPSARILALFYTYRVMAIPLSLLCCRSDWMVLRVSRVNVKVSTWFPLRHTKSVIFLAHAQVQYMWMPRRCI